MPEHHYEQFGSTTALSEDGEWLIAGVPQAPYDAGRGGECRLYRYVAPPAPMVPCAVSYAYTETLPTPW